MSKVQKSAIAGLAFDLLADQYDSLFTFSAVGRAQREVVWEQTLAVFLPDSHILELNCGTGEDALFLAKAGMRVTACDASSGMIEKAQSKVALEGREAQVELYELATEDLRHLPRSQSFDGVFSNFSGLNCVKNLSDVAREIALRVKPGAPLLLCLSTRYCLWEIIYFLLRGNPSKAVRRWKGSTQASIGSCEFSVYYPTLSQLRRTFAPNFRVRSVRGVGITVPPSYLETWVLRHPVLHSSLKKIDSIVRTWPVVRTVGDHMLLHLERI